MLIKCGRKECELSNQDVVMWNGAIYQVITKRNFGSWHSDTPIIARAKAEKMIKEGILIKSDIPHRYGTDVTLYQLK